MAATIHDGGNTLEARAMPFLARIEDHNANLDSLRGSYMAGCKVVRAKIKDVYAEAKDAGVNPRALKGVVKHRQLARKQEKIAASLEDVDDAAAYAELIEKLGPSGAAAAKRHGFGDEPKEHITSGDEFLSRVGRGPAARQPSA